MAACANCGGTKFVAEYKVTGKIYVTENFDGSTEGCENTGMWDSALTRRTKKARRCYDCDALVKE